MKRLQVKLSSWRISTIASVKLIIFFATLLLKCGIYKSSWLKTIKSEPSQSPVATSSERFHESKLLKDLQQLTEDDQSLDCTIVATKDKREIKVRD